MNKHLTALAHVANVPDTKSISIVVNWPDVLIRVTYDERSTLGVRGKRDFNHDAAEQAVEFYNSL